VTIDIIDQNWESQTFFAKIIDGAAISAKERSA
jgi:hypothetical protein